MPPVFDDALCLRQWDWSETSQTAILFTCRHGLVRVLAKGSKRQGSPYSGGLEMLTRGGAGFIPKADAELIVLTDWDLRRTFPALRSNLNAHNAGLYVAELLGRMIQNHDPHEELFHAACRCLEFIGRASDAARASHEIARALLGFQWALLVETGYRPGLTIDGLTGEPLPESETYAFVPERGSFCVPGVGGGERTWVVRAATLETLRRVERDETESVGFGEDQRRSIDRANRLLASYVRYLLGEEPRTLPIVFPKRMLR